MSVELAALLLRLTLALSVAVAIAALLRKPLRRAVGARTAYWLWLLVPVSALAVLLPAPSQSFRVLRQVLPESDGLGVLMGTAQHAAQVSTRCALPALWLWAGGALLAGVLVLQRQLRFLRQLGPLQAGPDGACRSAAVCGPMLVGTWRPRVVLPADFDARYSAEERALVLAHERAHLKRRDALMNALAVATLCLNWFNPVLHWALGRFRFDQELACDAEVLSGAGAGVRRRSYADALMKTQVAGEAGGLFSLGCHWQPIHPLTERIAMLKHPLPGSARRRAGIALLVGVIGTAGYACWAAQPAAGVLASGGAPIAIRLRWNIDETVPATDPSGATRKRRLVVVTELLAKSGHAFSLYAPSDTQRDFEAQCTPSLGAAAGQITVQCQLKSHGQVLGTPSVLVADGETARLSVNDGADATPFRLAINASTDARRIAAAEHEEVQDPQEPQDQDDAGGAEDEADLPDPPDPPDPPEALDADGGDGSSV